MKSLLQHETRQEILVRVESVSADARPQWGRMDVRRMLTHIVAALKMATGELVIRPMPLPTRWFPLRQIVLLWIRWWPFPRSAPTAPELLDGEALTIQGARAEVARLLESFASPEETASGRYHPAFGFLSREIWARLTYRHLDHHLRQFGA